MTPNDFIKTHERLGISRAELCLRLGLSPNAATGYALGRKRIPRYIVLACLALEAGLDHELDNSPPQEV
jgi:transcriptional regulator with XRE-family HTH domain